MSYVEKVREDVYWVGVNDRETQLFESLWPLPGGVSYNSYLILDEKVALIDTVKKVSTPGYIKKLKQMLGEGRKIDYLVLHHLEPDHSGSIPLLLELFPGIQVIGSKKAGEFLEHLYGVGLKVVSDGDVLDLGRKKLKFVMTPMVHWPETMMSYEPESKILFSGDAFGGFGTLDGGIFDDVLDMAYYEEEILRYFSNIIGKFAPMVQKAIDKLRDLDIGVVASTHGPVWRSRPQRIIDLYDKWSSHETEEGILVAYGTMYGNTERMMEAVARGITQAGQKNVVIHDVSSTHVSYIIRDIWRYRGLVLGCPTYDGKLFPAMGNLVDLLSAKRLQNRCYGCFGSYGWSGAAVKMLREYGAQAGFQMIEPAVEARFTATDEQIADCTEMGRKLAEATTG